MMLYIYIKHGRDSAKNGMRGGRCDPLAIHTATSKKGEGATVENEERQMCVCVYLLACLLASSGSMEIAV